MSELIAISAVVADRSYRIKVSPKDEEVVRRTLKTINDRIIEFKTQFAGKDMQDYIAMVLLWYATEKNSGVSAGIEHEAITEQLKSIEKLIDIQLNS
ncbi:MAG TPA: cell division protein ZapA [Chitinophagaceae bacterium]|nr:cell division protein ZapA [Chitinophagaceae bacterium]